MKHSSFLSKNSQLTTSYASLWNRLRLWIEKSRPSSVARYLSFEFIGTRVVAQSLPRTGKTR
ncbi:hypothetical protein HanXRQr2_Chr13g0574451 [Helianthus annuus]|uniref:Uncharacterized protein n=1 Tax=Helianthus annuus TaxID=4232 RepID=A0A9K3EER6_HELAN|nr:hypothetical protein HanXRQr2_Chr13g0574451 [Helianthus annuus]KAJ0848084.1 hypothetical protein HanPSC8_Chr13g0553031 [Helianthus annuus]